MSLWKTLEPFEMEFTLGCQGGGALLDNVATQHVMSLDGCSSTDNVKFEQQIMLGKSIEMMRLQLELKKMQLEEKRIEK